MQVTFDFPAFIPMLQWLFRLIIHFPEGVLWIANGFTDDFQRFGHSLMFLFSSLARREKCSVAFPCSGLPCLINGTRCFKRSKRTSLFSENQPKSM
jgi:hypothetical protein